MSYDEQEQEQPADVWGQPISEERQAELAAMLTAWDVPGAEHGKRKGPFDDARLTGADVSWLVEKSRRDENGGVPDLHLERARLGGAYLQGANLRAALLQGADLGGAYLQGADLGSAHLERASIGEAHLEKADLGGAYLEHARLGGAYLQGANLRAALLQGANLRNAHLEEANLAAAHLEEANLAAAHLEGADLRSAHLEKADLGGAYLERAGLFGAHLEEANLREAHLERAGLRAAHLEGVDLIGADLTGADLGSAHLKGANLGAAHLKGASLFAAYLEGARLGHAHLQGASLRGAHLEGADLGGAYLEGARLGGAYLQGADLRSAWLDSKTELSDATLDAKTQLGDIHWSGVGAVDLTQLNWGTVPTLGDEQTLGARAKASEHAGVVRAYRQVAAQLRAQGVNEVADRFLYRAQVYNRKVLRRSGRIPQWLGSLLLAGLAGYGYRPGRTILWYLAVIAAFGAAYFLLGPTQGHVFHWYGALIFSVTSFHGRGFFPESLNFESWVTGLAATEAVLGLLIEISFIATFTQRFFNAR
jgi:uncharacterized protein YjbI with pentapeptide repeats